MKLSFKGLLRNTSPFKHISAYFLLALIILSGCISQKQVTRVEATGNIGINEGDTAPEFTVRTIENEELTSENLKGTVTVITSSAAWCATCKLEAKEFAPVYDQFKDNGVEFITVDIDGRDTVEAIADFRKKYNTPWPYADFSGAQGMIKTYRFDRFEITYVINKQGVIVFKDQAITPSDTLRQAIQVALSL